MKKSGYILLLLLVLLVPSGQVMAQASSESDEKEKVDVKDVIFSHIKDSYSWHLFSTNNRHFSIYLPVIVYSKEMGGWSAFSSRRLEHGAEYNGYHISETSGKVVYTNGEGTEVRPFDMSYTKVAMSLTINALLLLVIVLCCGRWYKRHNQPSDKVPSGFVGFFEYVVTMVSDDIIKPGVGPEYKRYEPYLLSVFFFIIMSNLLGLVPVFPAGANVTGNISITMFLALCTFIAVNVFGNKEYWKEILWPDVPVFLKCPLPLMPLIEFFGILTKPFALMVRLFANMMAGHVIILSLTCVIFVTAPMGAAINGSMTVVSILFMVFMNMMELLVAYIQAYVFTMLSSVFIGMSRPHGHIDKKE